MALATPTPQVQEHTANTQPARATKRKGTRPLLPQGRTAAGIPVAAAAGVAAGTVVAGTAGEAAGIAAAAAVAAAAAREMPTVLSQAAAPGDGNRRSTHDGLAVRLSLLVVAPRFRVRTGTGLGKGNTRSPPSGDTASS